MIKCSYVLLDATKADKNGRVFTKECWDGIINSEENKCHAIPVVNHIDSNSDLTSIPVADVVGMADLSWANEQDINVSMRLTDEKLKDIAFMPSFSVEAENIKTINSIDVISKGSLNCLFATETPAMEVASGDRA